MVEVVCLVHVEDHGSWFKWFVWCMLWTMVHGLCALFGSCCGPWFMGLSGLFGACCGPWFMV